MRDEPHPSPIRRGALLYNIWDSARGGHGDRDGGVHAARGALRRPAARPRDRLDHAGAARGARARLALRAGQPVRPAAGQGIPGQVDAARLDAPGPRPARLRAAALPAPARLRHQLRDRQAPARRPDARARGPARQGLHARAVLRRGERRRHDPGVHDPLAAHRGVIREEAHRLPRIRRRLRRAGRHDARLQRPARRQEIRRAEDRDPGRRTHARHLLVPRQRPRAGHRGGHRARCPTEASRATGRPAGRPTARPSTSVSRSPGSARAGNRPRSAAARR